MDLAIEYKKIDDLIPYANNSRIHTHTQIAQIASSIKEFGWTNPILLDGENGIIAGHGRLQAARLLGEKNVPTIQLNGLTEMQKKAYIIADNKLALNAGWDNELLGIEITDLREAGFDIDLIGFTDDELKDFESGDDEIKNENEVINESKNLLMIECVDERELELIFEEMQERGFECKILS
jgi:ParB-like chromosome segregation protein Spo0J